MHTCRLLGCIFVSLASCCPSTCFAHIGQQLHIDCSSLQLASPNRVRQMCCFLCRLVASAVWHSFIRPSTLPGYPSFKGPHCTSAVPLTPCAGELVKLKAGNYIHPIVRYWVTYVLTDDDSKVGRGSSRLGQSAAGCAGVALPSFHWRTVALLLVFLSASHTAAQALEPCMFGDVMRHTAWCVVVL